MVRTSSPFLTAVVVLLAGVRASGQGPAAGICVREGFGYTYCASQCEGEARLDLLAREAVCEDAWLFADGLWIDIGYEERGDSVLCSWDAVRSVTGIRAQGGLVWYHVHPKASAPTGVHPPSIDDVLALALLKDLCEATFGAGLVGRVFDGVGVWEIDLSEELRGRLKTPPAAGTQPSVAGWDPRDTASLLVSPARRRDVAALAFYLKHEGRARAILGNASLGRAETIERYIAEMSGIGLLLHYTELPPQSPAAE